MRIISRDEWGARPPKSRSGMRGNRGLIVHHSVGPSNQSVRSIQDFHMNSRGWADIGYNFLVDLDGNIYEGRGANVLGAHTTGANSFYHGVCVIGTDQISQPAKDAIVWLHGHLGGGELTYHSNFGGTACPGDNIRNWILGAPHDTGGGGSGGGGGAPDDYHTGTYRQGSRGPGVAHMQENLAKAAADYGVDTDPQGADGIFGPNTERALRNFQSLAGITADGIFGPQSRGKLEDAYYRRPWMTSGGGPGIQPPPTPAPPPAQSAPPCPGVTRQGNRGDITRQFQQRLADRGWSIEVDGIHGPQTTSVLRAFQAEKGLEVDGIGGPQTWQALWTAPIT